MENKSLQVSIDSVKFNNCTGCLSCVAVCPRNAISFQYNNEGFWFPEICTDICINCGKCYRCCPEITPQHKNTSRKNYIVQHKDKSVVENSASGGAFYGFAQYIITQGGSVYGCVLNEQMMPIHICIEDENKIAKMQGSKYVQSYISDQIYQMIKLKLETDNMVLFSGTPCQIAGLYAFLGRDFPKLFTVGLICHGVASPGLYKHYIAKKEKEIGEKVLDVQFRSRKVGKYPENHSLRIMTEHEEYCRHGADDPYASCFIIIVSFAKVVIPANIQRRIVLKI